MTSFFYSDHSCPTCYDFAVKHMVELDCRITYCVLCLPVQGERALGFVLGNKGMIDKTLLFDIELLRLQR
jgi:hypothetical protein